MKIYGTKSERYIEWAKTANTNNGAYWYAREIEDIILPKIHSKATIVTAGAALYDAEELPDGVIIVCHDNRTTESSYGRLFGKNALWICSKQSTVELLSTYGEAGVYIPLSIDTRYIKKFKATKTKEIAFVGNKWSFKEKYLRVLPKEIDQISGLEREDLLREMAKYKEVIAEGRCLMEAQVLGAKCSVPTYRNLESIFIEPLDSRDAIKYWREAMENTTLQIQNLNIETGQ